MKNRDKNLTTDYCSLICPKGAWLAQAGVPVFGRNFFLGNFLLFLNL
ncbi:unnamed protein product [Leptidea sinapis]|uniref:Uncharacterized protein n=1 Tax=Leptidea sinapis TaxID=189913 RepID=A0A5E4R041_9NEOP|nr:unnamed protein product [Leptidea sinapis]